MKSATVFQVYSDYLLLEKNKNKKSMLLSVIARFLIDIWGGQCPKGDRATTRELIAIEEFMKGLPVTILINSLEALEKAYLLKGKTKQQMRSYKSEYKSFVTWVELNKYYINNVSTIETIDTNQKITNNIFNDQIEGRGYKRKTNYHNQIKKLPFALMARYSSSTKKRGELIYPSDYINEFLNDDIAKFKYFRIQKQNCTPQTFEMDRSNIFRILGWLHRYKNISLDQLRLSSIIYFIELNINLEKYSDYNNYLLDQLKLNSDVKTLAKNNEILINEYFAFIQVHPNTLRMILSTLIALSKFIFENEIEAYQYENDRPVPIIIRLNKLYHIINEQAKIRPPSIKHEAKSLCFSKALEALETLRKTVEFLEINSQKKSKKKFAIKQHTYPYVIDKNSLINTLQLFLSLAFMVLIPTDRARTYYELEIGRTLVQGIFEKNKFFPVDKALSKSESKWYIHLLPEDYKTGKIYKEYWGEINNFVFSDGKTLYGYIDKWITEGKDYEKKCDHNYFFRCIRTYKPMNCVNWGGRIKGIFINLYNVPVTPKELRKMYITYINNQGATNAQLKGAAYAMHHSTKTQESEYNSQTDFDRIAPIMDLNERMWKEIFGSSSDTE